MLLHKQLAFLHGPQSDATAVLVYEWEALTPENQARLLERRQRYFHRWSQVLEGAHAAGITKADPVMLRQLLHGATVWTVRRFDPSGPMSLDDLETALLAMVLWP